jgi:hypothetical protein
MSQLPPVNNSIALRTKFALMGLLICLLQCGCVAVSSPPSLPEQYLIDEGQLRIHSDFQLAESHRLVRDLVVLRRDLANLLGVEPSDEPIHVFLFENADDHATYMQNKHPDFPARRALFVKTDTQLKVYASWHERVAEDLRHEVAHGYLHSAVPEIPLWLDEGLAEFFEVGRGKGGSNSSHIHLLKARLAKGEWAPDLAKLESVESPLNFNRLHYAEAWLWAHFLMFNEQIRERHLVQAHLVQLRKHGTAFKMSTAVDDHIESVESALVEHLNSL